MPMSFLDREEDPCVGVLVSGLCGKGECELQTRRDVQEEMSELSAEGQTCVEITSCKICGKTEGTMRCGRYKVIAYYRKEHQKQE